MSRFHRLEFEQTAAKRAAMSEIVSSETDAMVEADQHRRNCRYEEALRCYSRALELDRALVKGWVGQVQMLVMLGECTEADLWSRKAMELFRENGDLMAGRAQALCRMGSTSDALTMSDQSLAQRDQSAYRWTVRGEVMLARGDAREGHVFDKAQQADGDWLVPMEIALVYDRYGKYTLALKRLELVAEKAPDHGEGWYLLGRTQSRLGLLRLARTNLQRCLEVSPKHAMARRELQRLDEQNSLLARLRGWLRR